MNNAWFFAWFFVGLAAGSVRRWSGWILDTFSSYREEV